LDTFDDQEEQSSNPYRGCQTGACFACGLGGGPRLPPDNGQRGGNTNIGGWQSSRPNPLPIFPRPNGFYTPILLPGMYFPLDMFVTKEIVDGMPLYTMEGGEIAQKVAAFLSHEFVHRHLLVGIVPMLMRLIASRCYALLPLL
jgi:hypothetical protein